MTPEQMKELAGWLAVPFYADWSFWISNVVGVLGLLFSILAFIEARRAKLAASDAGRIVKIQTITIELTEIAQRLDKLDKRLGSGSCTEYDLLRYGRPFRSDQRRRCRDHGPV